MKHSRQRKRKLPPGFLPRVDLHETQHAPGAISRVQANPHDHAAASSTGATCSNDTSRAISLRRDAPILRLSTRGRRELALAATESPCRRQAAYDELVSHIHAASSSGPQETLWTTWCDFHAHWWGTDMPVLPLTPEKVYCVASMFKRGGYRSFANYMSRAKAEHIVCEMPWTESLDIACRNAIRSVSRGLGPPRQSGTIPMLEVVQKLDLQRGPYTENGPCKPVIMFVISVFFLLREIEASLCLASHVTIDRMRRTITIKLSASKTDPAAISVSRTWGCICDGDAKVPCAYHAGAANVDALIAMFADDSETLPCGLPFFPTLRGHICSKESVVQAFEGIANDLDLPVTSSDGSRLLGGHTARVSGAQQLSAPPFCMELMLLQLLARWSGPTILKYVRDAPLLALTSVTSMSLRQHRPISDLTGLSGAVSVLEDAMGKLRSRVDAISSAGVQHLQELAGLRKLIDESGQQRPPEEYILNVQSNVTHKPLVHSKALAPEMWRSYCGWKFGYSRFRLVSSLPHERKRMCSTCFSRPSGRTLMSQDSSTDKSCCSES